MIDRIHPLTLLIYFLYAGMISAFSRNPFMHGLTLICGVIMLFTWNNLGKVLRKLPLFLLFFVLISIFNPFFYHNGNTVLFYMAGRRITLEALLFGADSALMVIGVMVWFISLSHYMTGDKVLYLFGRVSAKGATIISLVMRLIPHYIGYIRSYRPHQRLLGLYGDGSFIESIRAEGKIFAGFLTWSLEHSMTTADSMTSRGYGVTRRRSFSPFRLRAKDILVLCISVVCAAIMTAGITSGSFATEYYPVIVLPAPGLTFILMCLVYIISSSIIPVISLIRNRQNI